MVLLAGNRKPREALVSPLCSRLPVRDCLSWAIWGDEKEGQEQQGYPDAISLGSYFLWSKRVLHLPWSLGICLASTTAGISELWQKGKEKKKTKHYKTKKGFPCTLSDPKGLPFCLCRPEREPLGSTFCLHLVCSSGFLAAFETTPGDARGKKETGNQGCFRGILSSGFLLPFTC